MSVKLARASDAPVATSPDSSALVRAEGAVRLVRLPLDWTLLPELAALLVRDDAHPFALIGRWAGGGALIGSEPVRTATADEDPFELLDDQVPVRRGSGATVDKQLGAAAGDVHPGAVAGGWFGWLGYTLG